MATARNPLVPVLMGKGEYGCYYYPRVPCAQMSASQIAALDGAEVLGSKVQVKSKLFEMEIRHAKRLVERVADHELYFVLPKRVCALEPEQLGALSDCDKLVDRKAAAAAKAQQRAAADAAADAAEGGSFLLRDFDYAASGPFVNMLMTNIEGGGLSMREYIHALPSARRWTATLECYRHLTEATRRLRRAGLVHWDMHSGNVRVDPERGVPYVIDFGLSIDATDAAERAYFASSFSVQPDLARWPLETQLLMWANHDWGRHGGEDGLADTLRALVGGTRVWDAFSASFRDRYVRGALRFYAGLRRAHARSDVLWLGWHTWDSYSLAVQLLSVVHAMYAPGFHVNNRAKRDLFALLLDAIHYDWRRRPTAEQTLERLDRIAEAADYSLDEAAQVRERPSFSHETDWYE